MAQSYEAEAQPAEAAATPGEDLAELRGVAMGVVRLLNASIQTLARSDPDQLLAKGGVIDRFTALSQVVINIVEQERRLSGAPAKPGSSIAAPRRPQVNEQALGQKLLAELDRIAERQRAAGVGPPDGLHPR